MARHYRFDAASRAVATASLAYMALLPLALACQSDAESDGGDDAVEQATTDGENSPGMGGPAARGDARTPSGAPDTLAAAAADDAPPAAAQSTTPAAPASPPDESQASPAAAGNTSPPAAPALVFEACTYSEGTYGRNCDSIFVAMTQASPPRCVQLTIDNCGEYGRQGLPVSVPMPWRLESGTVSSDPDECELGVFNPSSSVALRASGSITWNDTALLPTELVLDLTLELPSSASAAANVDVATAEPIDTVVCDR